MKNLLAALVIAAGALCTAKASAPKLIVVISLDQYRYDYIARFGPHFGKGGFSYLLEHGANFSNASFKHATTTTGPGHAAMLSGTYGNVNGIIANDWYDRATRSWMYCAKDAGVSIVGGTGEGRSPKNFIGSTLGDELRIRSAFRSKVISMSNKDRAAILMAGKMPTAAYWMKDSAFVTSSYYMADLPAWVKKFNATGVINSFFGKTWNKMLPDSAYLMMDDDDVPYEQDTDGMGRSFPHPITGRDRTTLTSSYYDAMKRSPFGARVLNDFAKQAIEHERLGQRGVPDLLCISYSAPDFVGHVFGPNSHEILDISVQVDRILADLFTYLDKRIGLKNCVLVLTADHGVSPIPEFLKRYAPTADAGRVPGKELRDFCSAVLSRRFGEPKDGAKWIDAIAANNIYFNRETFRQMTVPTLEWAATELADSLRSFYPIAAAYSTNQLAGISATTPLEGKMKRSFHRVRSGDVFYSLKPYWTEGSGSAGAEHGEAYDYDAHVPVIIVAGGIRPGTYATVASPIDIGPTLSALLGIEFPAGREGRVLTEAFK